MADSNDLPFPYEIDETTGMVYATVGPWSPEAVATWVDRLLNDPRYVPGMRGLLNLQYAAGPLPDAKTTMAIADALTRLTHIPVRTRWAILVSAPALFDRVRLLETYTSSGFAQIRGFLDQAEAIRWLGLHRNGPERD